MPSKAKSRGAGAAFVRTLPLDMPSREVVEKGKALGLKFSRQAVHSVRHVMRAKAAKAAGKPTTPTPPKPNGKTANGHTHPSTSVEGELVSLVLRVGLDRTRTLLDQLEQRIEL
jgi:hypothetical protein